MKTKQIIPSIDPEGLLMKCNVNYILMFFQNKLLVNQKCKLVADMMNGWMGMCARVHVRVRVCVCTYIACTQLISPVQFFVAPWTVAHQALYSWVFFQARIQEWIAISSSRASSQARDQSCISWVSYISRQILYLWVTWKVYIHIHLSIICFFQMNSQHHD